MKVDLPQPESAASPITMGVSPSFNAICNDEDLVARRLDGMNAVVVAAVRATATIESFMINWLLLLDEGCDANRCQIVST